MEKAASHRDAAFGCLSNGSEPVALQFQHMETDEVVQGHKGDAVHRLGGGHQTYRYVALGGLFLSDGEMVELALPLGDRDTVGIGLPGDLVSQRLATLRTGTRRRSFSTLAALAPESSSASPFTDTESPSAVTQPA